MAPNFLSSLVSAATAVITSVLSQSSTNGLSHLGTLEAATFSSFLTDDPMPTGYPWGRLTAANANPSTAVPSTGVVRAYNFTLTRGQLAPDGYMKDMIFVNGQFPAPTLEGNWGDTFEITVNNAITGPPEGTSMHWHGILQKQTPWADGVPGVQQCPIAPGTTFTYTFQADLYGSSWYHSHYSAQYAAGVFGAMIIHGPSNAAYDIDLGPVFLTDWYHRNYTDILDDVMGTDLDKVIPYSDNNLINGKMNFDCSTVAANDTAKCTDNAGISKFKFTHGKTHRLRLLNAGAEGIQRFSIDGHSLTVIANDFVPIKPYTTDVVTLAVGQRTDVLVTANVGSPTSSYWMRSNISSLCSYSNQGSAVAAIYYDKAETTKSPTSQAWPYTETTCANDDLTKTEPYYPIAPTLKPATTHVITIGDEVNATGHFLWTMNGQTFRADYNDPVFLLALEGNTSYPYDPEWNVENFGSSSSVRVIVNNPTAAAHPMHLHGHNMFVLSSGSGDWDNTTLINTHNPQRRDVQIVEPNGHIVIQFDADTPGAWPFHCHIAWHVSSGLYATFLERPADIAKIDVPDNIPGTCKTWSAWEETGIVVDQIDSGL